MDVAVIVALILPRELVYGWGSMGNDVKGIGNAIAALDILGTSLGKCRIACAG
ncbi:hypothetical protein D3C73_1565650 [compost metagenome]